MRLDSRLVATIVGSLFLVGAGAAVACPPLTTTGKARTAVGGGQATLVGITAGCHGAFDRVVIRARNAAPLPGYGVRYVAAVAGPSGIPVVLLGNRRLRVTIAPARGHDGGASLLPAVVTPRCSSLRQVKVVEDFEGVVVLGLGIRGTTAKRFCVFHLAAPTRIVVDVSH